MPAAVPLNNAIAQNSLDFNNQNPTNKGGLFRYKINNYGALGLGAISQHAFTNADLNAVCLFTGDVNITFPPFNFNPAPLAGSEILFYSSNGRIKLEASGGNALYSSIGNFTVPSKAGKLIYTANNTWFFSSLNTNSFGIYASNCCAGFTTVYQVGSNGSFNIGTKVYTETAANYAFNGTIVYDAVTYNVINGYASATGDCGSGDIYATPYTFYTDPETPVTFYSLTGGSPDNYISLLGKKFFTLVPSGGNPIYACADNTVVAPSSPASYYGSTAQYPNYPVTFLDGYVIDFDGIPYIGIPV